MFGHPKPETSYQELAVSSPRTTNKNPENLTVIVVHTKPERNDGTTIKEELQKENPLHVKCTFPEQGKTIQRLADCH